MRRLGWIVLLLPSLARADRLAEHIAALWGDELGSPPASPGLLLFEMAREPERSQRVLARASLQQIAICDTLLGTIALTENEARQRWEQLYVVRDNSPARDYRPPSWIDLRREGVLLFERIALSPSEGRDLRLSRDLAARREAMRRETPSEIAGLVLACLDWWAERGHDPRYYLSERELPRVEHWFDELGQPSGLWKLLARLHDDPLRRRMLLERLHPTTHAFLAAPCMQILGSYQPDFVERGFAERAWDPEIARMRGYHEHDLWNVGLEVFARVTPHLPSGAEQAEQLLDAFGWWRRARYELRYWDEFEGAPSLPPWLLAPTHPAPMSEILRDLYVLDELGPLFAEELDRSHAVFVAEWMQWLRYDAQRAREAGFLFAVRRFPVRPEREPVSRMMSIPWEQVQDMMLGWLPQLTGHRLEFTEPTREQAIALWQSWWVAVQRDAQWYRDPAQRPQDDSPFAPRRARAGD